MLGVWGLPPENFTKYDKYFGRFGAIWVGVCLLYRAVSNTRGEQYKLFWLSQKQKQYLKGEGKCWYPSEGYEKFKIVHIFQAISDQLEVKLSNEYSKIQTIGHVLGSGGLPPENFTKYDKYFGRFGAIWVGVCLPYRAVSNTRGELKKIKCDFFSMQFPANLSDDQRAIQVPLVILEIEIIIEKRGQVLVSFRRLRKL